MKIFKKSFIAAATMLAALSARGIDFPQYNATLSPDRKVAMAEQLIENYYLDDVDGDKLAQEAIVAMLKTLDPHSNYSDPEETKELTTPLDGNFSGIGIQFQMLNDTLYVIQTVAGGPSERVGMLPGDRIIKADTTLLSGAKKANTDITKTLRGPKGTTVDLEVLRKGVDRPIYFSIIRDDIPLNSVDAAFMADPTTGFIRISRFAETTGNEVGKALADLRKQGMKNLIIDLQDNGGGYLGAAVDVASYLLNYGDMVVYTDSPKFGRSDFRAQWKRYEDSADRVVVMVNQYSASASEILSGAIQDHDRGVIVGRRTFGKGLVQRPFPFPDGSMIRLTVSRYHTPSGRVIQKPYEKGNEDSYRKDMRDRWESGELTDADKIEFPDSLRYATLRNGRTVYGGGGIMPDRYVAVDTTKYTDYHRDLTAKGVFNKFAINYVDEHRKELKESYKSEKEYIDLFNVTDEMMQQVVDAGIAEGVELNEEQYAISRPFMEAILKGLIGRDLYDMSVYYRTVYPLVDPIYQEALRLINSPEEYESLLKGS